MAWRILLTRVLMWKGVGSGLCRRPWGFFVGCDNSWQSSPTRWRGTSTSLSYHMWRFQFCKITGQCVSFTLRDILEGVDHEPTTMPAESWSWSPFAPLLADLEKNQLQFLQNPWCESNLKIGLKNLNILLWWRWNFLKSNCIFFLVCLVFLGFHSWQLTHYVRVRTRRHGYLLQKYFWFHKTIASKFYSFDLVMI